MGAVGICVGISAHSMGKIADKVKARPFAWVSLVLSYVPQVEFTSLVEAFVAL